MIRTLSQFDKCLIDNDDVLAAELRNEFHSESLLESLVENDDESLWTDTTNRRVKQKQKSASSKKLKVAEKRKARNKQRAQQKTARKPKLVKQVVGEQNKSTRKSKQE